MVASCFQGLVLASILPSHHSTSRRLTCWPLGFPLGLCGPRHHDPSFHQDLLSHPSVAMWRNSAHVLKAHCVAGLMLVLSSV